MAVTFYLGSAAKAIKICLYIKFRLCNDRTMESVGVSGFVVTARGDVRVAMTVGIAAAGYEHGCDVFLSGCRRMLG
jgi:hypothetical protein